MLGPVSGWHEDSPLGNSEAEPCSHTSSSLVYLAGTVCHSLYVYYFLLAFGNYRKFIQVSSWQQDECNAVV